MSSLKDETTLDRSKAPYHHQDSYFRLRVQSVRIYHKSLWRIFMHTAGNAELFRQIDALADEAELMLAPVWLPELIKKFKSHVSGIDERDKLFAVMMVLKARGIPIRAETHK